MAIKRCPRGVQSVNAYISYPGDNAGNYVMILRLIEINTSCRGRRACAEARGTGDVLPADYCDAHAHCMRTDARVLISVSTLSFVTVRLANYSE